MFVRLMTSLAGVDGAWSAGELYECDEATARRLIAAGYAVPTQHAGLPVVIETAEASGGPERAVLPKGRRKP